MNAAWLGATPQAARARQQTATTAAPLACISLICNAGPETVSSLGPFMKQRQTVAAGDLAVACRLNRGHLGVEGAQVVVRAFVIEHDPFRVIHSFEVEVVDVASLGEVAGKAVLRRHPGVRRDPHELPREERVTRLSHELAAIELSRKGHVTERPAEDE